MPKCKNISKSRSKLCIGSLRTSIIIYDRDQKAPSNGESHSEEYSNPRSVRAQIETKGKGIDVFDGVSQDFITVSHVITMRFMSNLTSENWLQFGGLNYDILKVENMDEENRYLRLYCALAGSVTKAGAL